MDKVKKYFFYAFIATCPIFFYNWSGDLRDAQAKFFQMMALGLIAIFFENIWLTLFMWLNIALFCFNGMDVGINQMLNIFLAGLLFVVSKNYFKNKSFMPFARILIFVAMVDMVWMIFQMFGIDPLFSGMGADGTKYFGRAFTDPMGMFGIKMANGIFLSIVYPILSILNPYLALILLIPIAMSHASTAILAWFISALYYTWNMKRKLFLVLSIAGVIAVGAYIIYDQKDDPNTFKSRFGMWHAVTRFSIINPIGYGPDSFRNMTPHKNFLFVSDNNYKIAMLVQNGQDAVVRYYNTHLGLTNDPWQGNKSELNIWDDPHNEYLKLFFEYGFFGLFLFIGLLREMVLRYRKSQHSEELVMVTSILLVYAVSSLAHFPLALARLGCLFPIFLGVWYARTQDA